MTTDETRERGEEARLHGEHVAKYAEMADAHDAARARVDALEAQLAILPEWQCPSCGATTRARMADHPTATQPAEPPRGCCDTCDGTGHVADESTGGLCSDCYATGHAHGGPCTPIPTPVAQPAEQPSEDEQWPISGCDCDVAVVHGHEGYGLRHAPAAEPPRPDPKDRREGESMEDWARRLGNRPATEAELAMGHADANGTYTPAPAESPRPIKGSLGYLAAEFGHDPAPQDRPIRWEIDDRCEAKLDGEWQEAIVARILHRDDDEGEMFLVVSEATGTEYEVYPHELRRIDSVADVEPSQLGADESPAKSSAPTLGASARAMATRVLDPTELAMQTDRLAPGESIRLTRTQWAFLRSCTPKDVGDALPLSTTPHLFAHPVTLVYDAEISTPVISAWPYWPETSTALPLDQIGVPQPNPADRCPCMTWARNHRLTLHVNDHHPRCDGFGNNWLMSER